MGDVKAKTEEELGRKILTGSDDDGGGFVVNGHGPVVGGHRQPAPHLVQATVHHGAMVRRSLRMRSSLAGMRVRVVVGINLDAFFGHLETSINAL